MKQFDYNKYLQNNPLLRESGMKEAAMNQGAQNTLWTNRKGFTEMGGKVFAQYIDKLIPAELAGNRLPADNWNTGGMEYNIGGKYGLHIGKSNTGFTAGIIKAGSGDNISQEKEFATPEEALKYTAILYKNNQKDILPKGNIRPVGMKEAAMNQGAPSPLAQTLSSLYGKLLKSADPFDIDDEYIDDVMERIVKQVGHTPEQKKKRGAYKFAFGGHPEFEKLTDKQLNALVPFLKAVAKNKSFSSSEDWDGKKIVSADEDGEDDNQFDYTKYFKNNQKDILPKGNK